LNVKTGEKKYNVAAAGVQATFLVQRQFERDLKAEMEAIIKKYDGSDESWEYWLNRTDRLPEEISVVAT
jgi:hypothetical protein